jgi:hypothetical protein
VAVDLYGCTLDDVDALLRWDIRRAEEPQTADVLTWIEGGAAELAGLIGEIAPDVDNVPTPPCAGDAWRSRAKLVVALYAAAMAEDAHFPERTKRAGSDYGQRLWERHKEQRDALVTGIEACRDGIEPGTARGGSGHSFPLIPLVTRDMGV